MEEKKRADVTYRTLRASEAKQSGAPASQTLKGEAYLFIYCFRNSKERSRFCLITQRSSPPWGERCVTSKNGCAGRLKFGGKKDRKAVPQAASS